VSAARTSVQLDEFVRASLRRRFTAAVLRVERAGRVAFERAYGALDDGDGAPTVLVTTRFDLASLTKAFVSTAVLRAVATGLLRLDEPLVQVFPTWRSTAHARITVRMLLAHTAGMHSGADYRTLLGANVEQFALGHELAAAPGERVLYSDLGFIVLGVLLARVASRSLARTVSRTIERAGGESTAYRPRNDEAGAAIPATEFDTWRGRVRGAVHDEKAYLMGGVAGHAGLFGTARDVAALAEIYLAAVNGRPQRTLPSGLALEAIEEQAADPVLRRGLGWALKTSDENSCGAAMNRATFGHTGFTGTCVWADPVRDLSVVFLTNAVYYGRRDLRDVRAAICDACVAAYG